MGNETYPVEGQTREVTLDDVRRKLQIIVELANDVKNELETTHNVLDKDIHAQVAKLKIKCEEVKEKPKNLRFDMNEFSDKAIGFLEEDVKLIHSLRRKLRASAKAEGN